MTKEFVTYEQALALKELGFDEFCFGYYRNYGTNKLYTGFVHRLPERFRSTPAPLKQQAFRWFREKQGMHHGIGFNGLWYYDIQSMKDTENAVHEIAHKWDMDTYEEAEQSCLDKLIEICKNK